MAVDQSDDARWRPDQKNTHLPIYLPPFGSDLETCDHSDIWSQWWGDMTWPWLGVICRQLGPQFWLANCWFKDVENYIPKCSIHKYTNTQRQNKIIGSIYNTNVYIGEYISVEFIYWHWIYSAKNRGIYVNWRVSVRECAFSRRKKHILEYTCFRIYIF